MRYHQRISAFCGALILFVLSVPGSGRADNDFSVETGFDVASGTYGTGASTTTKSVLFSVGYQVTPRFDIGAATAYIWQNNALVVGGKPVQTAKPSGRPPTTTGSSGTTSRSSAVSGAGDVLLSAGYTAVAETDTLPEIRPTVGVKLPTASAELGSGAVDATVGITSSKFLGAWYLYLNTDYTVQGKTSLYNARNFFGYDLGAGYEVLPGLLPALSVKGTSATEEHTGATAMVEGKVTYVVTRRVNVKGYLGSGLTTSSPDWETGFSVGLNF